MEKLYSYNKVVRVKGPVKLILSHPMKKETVLGKMNPVSLNYTMFFLISQHFGTRGRQEHHQMKIEDFKVCYGIDGKVEIIEWMEGPTKTRQGGLNKKPRMVTQKLFRTGGKKCPVATYELLISKRPPELKFHGPLYLTPLRKNRLWDKADVWFTAVPIGVNSIDTFLQKIVAAAGLDSTKKHFTNHSIRKTTVKKLKKAGVSPSEIMAITGHKNQQSLTDYDELDNDDHIRLGKILSYDRNEVNTHVQYSKPQNQLNCSSCNYPPTPVFHIQNCNVTIGIPSCQPCDTKAPKERNFNSE